MTELQHAGKPKSQWSPEARARHEATIRNRNKLRTGSYRERLTREHIRRNPEGRSITDVKTNPNSPANRLDRAAVIKDNVRKFKERATERKRSAKKDKKKSSKEVGVFARTLIEIHKAKRLGKPNPYTKKK